ncbi:hypothetical protein DICPUDRAFT_32762 [Dictyostelium purpureum]|uniref:Myotubularin phosphatase domain-containing protein n=1 Tax=Dictyostelium purpureum TaxID=5786 RepID=F0ZJQ0_DICPU|nr:uncharacterized protein DICPUDRAFT_32762 [Dictyostelium purpureum]EGC35806.1 hypothetical protein DICPUDRAFT_32762 [Dictyostelium purpureum]|eukprot:XP_003287643.1 hypothetical protein DICPUDRAFT_32762 [Dictyostelium purpureum]
MTTNNPLIPNEHPEISNIINNLQNKKILDLKVFLENTKQFSDFRKHLIEKNKYSLASMLQCYESIQSFKQSFLVDNPPFNLKLANDIISTFLVKPGSISPNSSSILTNPPATNNSNPLSNSSSSISPPPSTSFYIGFIDASVYNSLKILLDPLWQKPSNSTPTTPLSVSTNATSTTSGLNTSGSLFDSSPLGGGLFQDDDSGLFGESDSNSNNNSNSNDNNTTTNTSIEDPEEPTKEQKKKQKEIKDDLSSHVTHNLFDVLQEFLLFKLENEYKKYINSIVSNLEPLVFFTNNQMTEVLDSPLTPQKNDKEDSMKYYINNHQHQPTNVANFNKLEGEKNIVWFNDQECMPVYYMDYITGETIPSLLYITIFRFVFVNKLTYNELSSIPLATVYRVDKVNNFKVDSTICIWGKNFRRIEFFVSQKDFSIQQQQQLIYGTNHHYHHSSSDNMDIIMPIITRMRQFAFQDVPNLFAFKYSPNKQKMPDGWRVHSDFKDFMRQGILSEAPGSNNKWRYSDVNIEHVNPTYPTLLVVPHNINDDEVRTCMNFRSKGRIPALSWISRDGVPLARSSQPMVGITRQKCSVDEKLVDAIRLACPTKKSLYLLDARPKANAIANVAKGMGYELNYNCDIEFLGIANIHSMRDSINKLESFVQSNNDENWLSGLNETKWLDHVRTVLLGVSRACLLINYGHPVLLHCSDGWDRTAQLTSLTMMIQDPYYRTIEGLQVLIEKEWLSFGHCFMNRVRHGDRNCYSDSQRSPIFLQFIDCVFQLMNQYYDYFEFNENYLITILDALYSCQFGTFLCNNDKERSAIKKDTVSLWSVINSNPLDPFKNPFYNNKSLKPYHLPEWRSEHIVLWKNYYLRYWRNPIKEPMNYQNIAISLKLKNDDLLKQIQSLLNQNFELSKKLEDNNQTNSNNENNNGNIDNENNNNDSNNNDENSNENNNNVIENNLNNLNLDNSQE